MDIITLSKVELFQKCQELGIKKENYLDFDFKNEFYDLVLSIDSLYMITDEKKLIKKIHHSLKSGGHFDLHITFIDSKRRNHLLKILKSIFYEVSITDYSHQDKLLWLKSNDYLIKNKLSFSSDVCKNVYMTKSNEVTKNLSLSKTMIRLHIRCTK